MTQKEMTQKEMTDELRGKGVEGWIWMSDKTEPEVIRGAALSEEQIGMLTGLNPFAVEAMIYDKANGISYSLRNIDGEAVIGRTDVGALGKDRCSEVEYLPNRIEGVGKLKFRRIWKLGEPDELCEGMRQEELDGIVFTGFKD